MTAGRTLASIGALAALLAGCVGRGKGGAAGTGGPAGAGGASGTGGAAGAGGQTGTDGAAGGGGTAAGGTTGTDGGAPITESEFCAQKAVAECQVTDRCLTDKAACKAARTTACTSFAAQAKASGQRMFVADNVAACISKTQAVYAKSAPITPAELAEMADACQYVFQGNGQVNVDTCDTKYDCAGHVICDKTFCATPRTVTTICGNPGETCPIGSYCSLNAASVFVCMPRGASGATCGAATPCLESLRCAAGTCADRLSTGQSCTTSDDCGPTAPFCDPYASDKCDPGLLFAAGSASCADFGGSGAP